MIEPLIVTAQDIANVAERWKRQYFRDGSWTANRAGDSEQIYVKLAALAPEATSADVAAIIGNDTWVGYPCTECERRVTIALHVCERRVTIALHVGQPEDYESETVYLCKPCAMKVGEAAAALADS